MDLERSFLIEGNDLQNLIGYLMRITKERIVAGPDQSQERIARARQFVRETQKAFDEADFSNAYEYIAQAYKQATRRASLPISTKRKAAYHKRASAVIGDCGPCRFNLDMCGYTRCGLQWVYRLDQEEEPEIQHSA